MSPTATIASVVVALILVAWMFQSDVRDPGYEAYQKRLQEESKTTSAQKASGLAISVTDSGVTKDSGVVTVSKDDPGPGKSKNLEEGGLVITGFSGVNPEIPGSTTKPAQGNAASSNSTPLFPPNTKLSGAYVRVGSVSDSAAQASPDASTVLLRRDGTFVTQNMFATAAEVDATGGALERGSGRYVLAGNSLDLEYTDGVSRSGGAHRKYAIIPIEGRETAPLAITISGKIFKLAGGR